MGRNYDVIIEIDNHYQLKARVKSDICMSARRSCIGKGLFEGFVA